LGIKTSFEAMRDSGWRPLFMVGVQTLLMAAMMLGLVQFII
jgi:uncharacterized membrane protein YadS